MFILVLLLSSMPLQAQESVSKLLWPDNPTATTTTYGNGSVTAIEGTVNGQPLYLESSRTGTLTTSTGSLGSKPVNTSTIRLNNLNITTRTVDNETVEVISYTPEED